MRFWRIAFALACLVNLAALYTPRSRSGGGLPYVDKLTHLLLFAAVAYTGSRLRLPMVWLAGALVLNAAISELVQHCVADQPQRRRVRRARRPGRSAARGTSRGRLALSHDMMGT